MLVVALATGLHVAVTGTAGSDDYSATLPAWFVQAISVLTVVGFYCFFWRNGGQTLGMKAWRVRLRNRDGGDISPTAALLRCAAAVVSLLPAGLGYWWCLIDREKLYWHDRISGTELELLPKPEK